MNNNDLEKSNSSSILKELEREEPVLIEQFNYDSIPSEIRDDEQKLSTYYRCLSLRLCANLAMQDLCRCIRAKKSTDEKVALSTYNYYAISVYLFFKAANAFGEIKNYNVIKDNEKLIDSYSEIFHSGEVKIQDKNNSDISIRTGKDTTNNINDFYKEEKLFHRVIQIHENFNNVVKFKKD